MDRKLHDYISPKWIIAIAFLFGTIGLDAWSTEPEKVSTNRSSINSRMLLSISAEPKEIQLNNARSRQGMVVSAHFSDGSTLDVTPISRITVKPESLVAYEFETILPKRDGSGMLEVTYQGMSTTIPVTVSRSEVQPPIEFRNELLPMMTKAGCNSGKCHGAASGKDGFRLSLFGYDPEGDYFRLTREMSGRRISLATPDRSLVVLKATGEVDHTGGQCIDSNSEQLEILLQWLHEGAKPPSKSAPKPIAIDVFPKMSVFAEPTGQQKLVVVAKYSDGAMRDVTEQTLFLSNNESVASVSDRGLVDANGPGAAFVLARFDQFTQGSSIIVRPHGEFHSRAQEFNSEIDRLVHKRHQFLHLVPSELCSDQQFLRRVTIDLTGLLPTVDEYREFATNDSPNKRSEWIEQLLKRSEFDDLWVMRWAELLQIRTNNGVSSKALRAYDQWLKDAVHGGMTIDRIVQHVLPANGGTLENPATNYYQTETTPQLIAENVAQVFMGTRIQCAQCHNHPFDRWTMDDYYGFASFFSQVGYKQAKDPRELTIYNAGEGEIQHPVPGRKVVPRFLGGDTPDPIEGVDGRSVAAAWLASNENHLFRNNIANIVWSHFFGIGIVEPVDDMRVSNPPSNPELLDYLGNRIALHAFDVRKLAREICNSRSYQLDTRRGDGNRLDEREFSHQKIRRLRAEVLLDCITQVTAAPEKLPGLPVGSRAVQVADGLASHYFLTTFGRSNRNSPCTCEVKTSPTLSQALHLLNGETTGGKVREGGIVKSLLEKGMKPLDVANQLYLRCLCREMDESEMKESVQQLANYPSAQEGLEDLFWALLNSNEFIFNH